MCAWSSRAASCSCAASSFFSEYWRRPDATAAAFTDDGFFKTGDVVARDDDDGRAYRILGRANVDILKVLGYKVSALQVEAALLEHDAVREAAVVGVDDGGAYGQTVAAAVVLRGGDAAAAASGDALRNWLADERLAAYKVPRLWRFVDELPRNAMGKVSKRDVAALFGSNDTRAA